MMMMMMLKQVEAEGQKMETRKTRIKTIIRTRTTEIKTKTRTTGET